MLKYLAISYNHCAVVFLIVNNNIIRKALLILLSSMNRYILGAFLLLCILKIDGKQNSGGIELVDHCMSHKAAPQFLPLLKSHYNNYSIKSIRRAFLTILLLTIKNTKVQ